MEEFLRYREKLTSFVSFSNSFARMFAPQSPIECPEKPKTRFLSYGSSRKAFIICVIPFFVTRFPLKINN
jgi:hypothetical protein